MIGKGGGCSIECYTAVGCKELEVQKWVDLETLVLVENVNRVSKMYSTTIYTKIKINIHRYYLFYKNI